MRFYFIAGEQGFTFEGGLSEWAGIYRPETQNPTEKVIPCSPANCDKTLAKMMMLL